MYRRREMAAIWKGLSFAYDTIIRNFVSLLEKNSSLRPMVESVSAQLKRGKAIGFSKAYMPKSNAQPAGGEKTGAPGRIKPVETELFQRKQAEPIKPVAKAAADKIQVKKFPWEDSDDEKDKPTGLAAYATDKANSPEAKAKKEKDQKEPEGEQTADGSRPPDPNAIHLTGDYLSEYLEETNGDDSQFKDIEPHVIPYSTGTSPRRERPDEFLFREDAAMRAAAEGKGKGGLDAGSLMAAQAKNLGVTPDQLDSARSGGSTGSKEAKKKVAGPPVVDVEWCKSKLRPMWLPIKAHRFTACRSKVLQLLPQRQLQQYVDHEKACHYAACIKLLETCIPGNLNVFRPQELVANRPLLIETIFQLLVGYIGLCLKNNDSSAAGRLCMQTLEAMQTALRDLHPAHRCVLEAYLYDTALSVVFYAPQDVQLAAKAESFFQQASERYLKLKHINRFAKCCIRYSAVLFSQNHHHEAEYFLQQALNKLTDQPASSLIVACYHNLCVETAMQDRLPDAGSHMRTYISLLRQMSKLSNAWVQKADNTQWLFLKLQDLWPAHLAKQAMGL